MKAIPAKGHRETRERQEVKIVEKCKKYYITRWSNALDERDSCITFKSITLIRYIVHLGDVLQLFASLIARVVYRRFSPFYYLLSAPSTNTNIYANDWTFIRRRDEMRFSRLWVNDIVTQAGASRITLTRRRAAINLHIIMSARPYERALVPFVSSPSCNTWNYILHERKSARRGIKRKLKPSQFCGYLSYRT